MQHQEGTWRK